MIFVVLLPMLIWVCTHDWDLLGHEIAVTNLAGYSTIKGYQPPQPRWYCAHGSNPAHDNIEISSPPEYIDYALPPKPIRITFSTEVFNGSKSELSVVNETFQNVIGFVSQILKTFYSRTVPIPIPAKFHPKRCEEFINDSDLHIFFQTFNCTGRIFEKDRIQNAAYSYSYHIINGSHPDVGTIKLETKYIPSAPKISIRRITTF
jgi:hypothetical protein